ncbi:MAG: OB-fold domain-containing protein [Desulfitobacteriaceae bacterium]
MTEKTAKVEEQDVFHPDFFKIPEDGSKPYLVASTCRSCGQILFPKLPTCPACWSDTFDDSPMERVGKLYTYTTMNVSQPGLKAPLAIGYVDFSNGIRVGAQIDVLPEQMKDLKIGMELQVDAGVIREDKNGKKTISYVFKPVVESKGGK